MTSTRERQDLRTTIIQAIDDASAELIDLSKFIHDNPEVAMQEVMASEAAADFLQARGFSVERGVADLPTAFRATMGSLGGPNIAFLAEYDALPGVGHGCGHNLIAIAGIGAGIGLAPAMESTTGTVTVFGTPAEEAIGGKVLMAEAGLFTGFDAALGAHPRTIEAECPTIEGSGMSLACQGIRIEFRGKAAHAAADPHNGINALNAVIETFNGINALRQQFKSDARVHGIITDGGAAANVIPDYAAAEFLVRGSTLKYVNELVEHVRRIAEGAALITGAKLGFSFPEKANFDMVTNYTLARELKANLDAVGMTLPEAKAKEGTGSTDWGNVSYIVPSVETSYPILDRVCTWHSQEVVEAADSELGYANTFLTAKAMALTGYEVLTNPSLREAIKVEFEAAIEARGGLPA
ncbi:MAG: amidohydrolase [Rhizobiales bacterium]|nr:amidohydrolase [Hyphomicrobiales bacterium]